MEGEPLTLDLFAEIQPFFERNGAPLAEYNFPNLYLFREKHAYRFLRGEKVIKGVTHEGEPYFIPLVYPFDIEQLKKLLQRESGILFPIGDEWLDAFAENTFKRTFLEGDSDYFFKRESLADLSGSKRATRRNLLYQFEKEHPFFEVLPLEEDVYPLALDLLKEWGETHQGNDLKSCEEAISLMEPLKLEGILVKEGNEPLGFAIFGPMNQQSLVIHFAKSLPRIKGGHVFLIERLAKATSYPWINMEQDLGIRGLRQGKNAFGPDAMRRKWRLSLLEYLSEP